MNWLVYLFGSGIAFFAGSGLIFVALSMFCFSRREWPKVVATLLAIIGLAFVILSATPLPYALYAALGVVTGAWLVTERSGGAWLKARRGLLRLTVALAWVGATAVEVPYHLTAAVVATGHPTFYIIGDSIAAGLNEREETWPRVLARTHGATVSDFSHVGADVTSALRQADKLPPNGGLVLLEIGGNDLLGRTTTADFEPGLDRLLARVCSPGRTVVMFELPLPPFCNAYGLAQRRLAAKYGVILIPKRILLAVLTGDAMTLDSIHLTPAGHEQLAEAVWRVIGPTYVG